MIATGHAILQRIEKKTLGRFIHWSMLNEVLEQTEFAALHAHFVSGIIFAPRRGEMK